MSLKTEGDISPELKVAARDLHYTLIEQYGLKDDPVSNHAIRQGLERLAGLAPEPAVWQPIETAPKDGKRVFVSCPVHQAVDMVAAFWNDDKQAWITTPGLYPCRPSHWMRPAQPPTKAGSES